MKLAVASAWHWPQIAFQNWHNSHSLIGSFEDLNNASVEDVSKFFKTYYAPNNAVLVIVGAHDTPFILAAADYMLERIPSARRAIIHDAAHLPNMDQPQEFAEIVGEFLGSLKD